MFFGIILITIILIGLNTASYVQKEKVPDSELKPNRSTFNTGSTGTRALYDLLAESGVRVERWRVPIKRFNRFDAETLSTFVIIGKTRREFTENEKNNLLDWVSYGGKLVIIDRKPLVGLLSTTGSWTISEKIKELDDDNEGGDILTEFDPENEGVGLFTVDPANSVQMTANAKAAKPQQPTIFTKGINGIQPSKFASSIEIAHTGRAPNRRKPIPIVSGGRESENAEEALKPAPPIASNTETNGEENSPVLAEKPSPSVMTEDAVEEEFWEASTSAPVVHFANDEKNLLVDFPYGDGQIVFLSDPYIVANGGIRLADNVQVVTNIVASRSGVIAFDEYHQGYGNNENQMLSYFSGTPVLSIFLQLILIGGLILFSQSRRFARAISLKEPNRISKLEYVSAMAQLQRRTKAYDLAIENIYKDFRRRVSRLVGVDNLTATREEIAELVSERTEFTKKEIEELMFKCEDIGHGEPTNNREILGLTQKLRKVERELGLQRKRKRI